MSYALHKVYEFVESITRGNFVEFWQSTQKMRLDLRNTLDPELDLQHAAFMSYALHKVYESVESITRELKLWKSTQKDLDLRNTLDPELDLQHAAFMSYALHKVYELVESITREGNFVEFWQSTQKKRLEIRITLDPELDLQTRVYELCPPQGYTSQKMRRS